MTACQYARAYLSWSARALFLVIALGWPLNAASEQSIILYLIDQPIWGVAIFSLYLVVVGWLAHLEISEGIKTSLSVSIDSLQRMLETREKDLEEVKELADLWKRTLVERTKSFPTLLHLLERYGQERDLHKEQFLRSKRYPATKAADQVRDEARRRRAAQTALHRASMLIEYYESLAPFLLNLREGNGDFSVDPNDVHEFSDDEKADSAVKYLSREEYGRLSVVERNQRALERYLDRPKSNHEVGRMYERYVGYMLEQLGYSVAYLGALKRRTDLGRDLLCIRDEQVIIVQCKYWSKFKTIYEKHIFQFFGTVFEYQDSRPCRRVKGLFITSTQLSPLAEKFANSLGIELKQNLPLNKNYPCIKCNLSKPHGEKIYHLPFDQQYDRVRIEAGRGEFYCRTVLEAEQAGFRRAFRWHPSETEAA